MAQIQSYDHGLTYAKAKVDSMQKAGEITLGSSKQKFCLTEADEFRYNSGYERHHAEKSERMLPIMVKCFAKSWRR